MKAAALLGLVIGVCAANPLHAQGTPGDWTAGKTGEGYDVIRAIAKAPARTALDVLCLPNGVGVRLEFGKAFGTASTTSVQVRYQFDTSPGQAPTAWALAFSGSNSTAQLAQSRVRQFVTKAKPSSEVTIRVIDPLNGEPVDITFPVKGLEAALAGLPCAKGY